MRPPFTLCRHPSYSVIFGERTIEERYGSWEKTVYTAQCNLCGAVTEEYEDDTAAPPFAPVPLEFAVISSEPCPRCSGKGVWTDYDGQDRAVTERCGACRGTGGVLVTLAEALAQEGGAE
jgi:hypothetical protein